MDNQKVIFVDDDQNILDTLRRNLRNNYEIYTASSGEEGLKEIEENGPFAVIVSDYRMPGLNGIELLAKVKNIAPDTVRVMLTGQADMQAAIDAVNYGSLFRFLTKPCTMEMLTNVLNGALEQYRLINAERELLEKTLSGSVKTLSHILGLLSPETFSYSIRISSLSRKIASRLGLNNLWEVEIAALLSQIGCITVPKEVLEKRYSDQDLSDIEKSMLNEYPAIGKILLAGIPRLEGLAEAIFYQAKNFDGSGFPDDDKKGTDLPIIARILRAVHDFDLLFQSEGSETEAIDKMRKQIYKYDPSVLNALKDEYGLIHKGHRQIIKEIYDIRDVPVGSVLAEDILSSTGVLLFPKGHEITEISKKRLSNVLSLKFIAIPIKVLIDEQ